jgi:hypothetical protein
MRKLSVVCSIKKVHPLFLHPFLKDLLADGYTDRKALGSDIHVPPTIVSRIEALLRERVVAEVEAFVTKSQQAGISDHESLSSTAGPSPRGPILAVLDFTGSQDDSQTGSTSKITYPENQEGGYPVYHVPSLFTSSEAAQMRRLFAGIGLEEAMISLHLPRSTHDTSVSETTEAQQPTIDPCIPDPIPLAIALWRFRLWRGDGWTGPPTGDMGEDDVRAMARELEKGRVVQGFKTVQGVLHAKWP